MHLHHLHDFQIQLASLGPRPSAWTAHEDPTIRTGIEGSGQASLTRNETQMKNETSNS